MSPCQTNWISVKDRKPQPRCSVYAILALMDDGEYRIYAVSPGDFYLPGVAFWQPLPDPPPRTCDAFETWWQELTLLVLCRRDHSEVRAIVGSDYCLEKEAARCAWNAALASVKCQPR